MKKRSYREDVDVQAEESTARQIKATVESTNGINFIKDIMLKMNKFIST